MIKKQSYVLEITDVDGLACNLLQIFFIHKTSAGSKQDKWINGFALSVSSGNRSEAQDLSETR